MTLRISFPKTGAVLLAAFLAAFGAGSAVARTPSCEAFALRAEKDAGIPTYLLASISRTETGHTRRGRGFGAWPWTLNIKGKGYYFDTKDEAIAAMRQAMSEGLTSIDVGCMQVNYRWHGEAFASLEDMFDPASNTAYAARFLTTLKDRHGGWDEAVKHYHSATDSLGNKYLKKVQTAFSAFSKDGFPTEQVTLASAPITESGTRRMRTALGDLTGYVGKINLPAGNLPEMPQSRPKAIPPKVFDFDRSVSGREDAPALLASLKASHEIGF